MNAQDILSHHDTIKVMIGNLGCCTNELARSTVANIEARLPQHTCVAEYRYNPPAQTLTRILTALPEISDGNGIYRAGDALLDCWGILEKSAAHELEKIRAERNG